MEPIHLAGCVIIDEYSRILLIHRNRGDAGEWELPGGKVEQDETAEQTAVRELREELDVQVRLTKSLGSEPFEQNDKEYLYHWFQAVIVKNQPEIMEPETFDDMDYFEFDDLPSLSLSINMQILESKLISGEVVFD